MDSRSDDRTVKGAASARPLRWLAGLQGGYFLVTGVWPLLDIVSFQVVTGPKVDLWLVKTAGVLITAIGATLLLAAWRGRVTPEIAFLAVASALGLTGIDVAYALADRISDVYLLDAAAEIGLVVLWAVVWVRAARPT